MELFADRAESALKRNMPPKKKVKSALPVAEAVPGSALAEESDKEGSDSTSSLGSMMVRPGLG